MLTLKHFLRHLTKGSRAAFAKTVETSLAMLEQYAYNARRQMSAEQAMRIEYHSGGLVRCETLRPDIPHLWHMMRQPRLDPALVTARYELKLPFAAPSTPYAATPAAVPAPSLRLG